MPESKPKFLSGVLKLEAPDYFRGEAMVVSPKFELFIIDFYFEVILTFMIVCLLVEVGLAGVFLEDLFGVADI
jgi:hypothetical protein